MPRFRTSLVKSAPKMPSRSRRRYRGTSSNGNASRSCCPVPLRRRVRRDLEMHSPPVVVTQQQEHVQHLKANGRHREEVNGHRGFQVVLQEGPPRLRRWTPTAGHVFADACLADVHAEFEKFAVDAWRAPKRVAAGAGNTESQIQVFLSWFEDVKQGATAK